MKQSYDFSKGKRGRIFPPEPEPPARRASRFGWMKIWWITSSKSPAPTAEQWATRRSSTKPCVSTWKAKRRNWKRLCAAYCAKSCGWQAEAMRNPRSQNRDLGHPASPSIRCREPPAQSRPRAANSSNYRYGRGREANGIASAHWPSRKAASLGGRNDLVVAAVDNQHRHMDVFHLFGIVIAVQSRGVSREDREMNLRHIWNG